MRPSVGKSFPVTNVREIINEVLLQVLDGNRYILHTISVADAEEFFFTNYPKNVRIKHTGKSYVSSEVQDWCRQIANAINRRIKELETPRYKHIVQVMLAEQTGAGCRYLARCIWDASCDCKISEQYKSESIVCIVVVFGIYRY